ncbi:MAG: multiheme c-type cytochrome [Candidatus Zixiibacteriota bacterium]
MRNQTRMRSLANYVLRLGKALMLGGSLLVLLVAMVIVGCEQTSSPSSPNPIDSTSAFKASDFEPATSCKTCHPRHFDEWSGSMHAYALQDPAFLALRRVGQSQYINALNGLCEGCHSPIGARSNEIKWGPIAAEDLSPVTQEGIGCDVCHTVTSLSRLSNAGFLLTPGNTKHGGLRDPQPNVHHASAFNDLYQSSEYCGSCHDLVTDAGLGLETVFQEWRKSGFQSTGKTCSDCHMTAYSGVAAIGGQVRTVHDHRFIGADIALIDFPNRDNQLAKVTEMLRGALTVSHDIPTTITAGSILPIQITLTNDKTGHDVPSGVPFIRQIWLFVIMRNQQGDTVYASGQLDANGDLMDNHSAYPERDHDLFNTQATMMRADSSETGFPWDAALLTNPSIKPGEIRIVDYQIPVPDGVSGTLSIEVKLRFRSFPPYVIRSLGLAYLLPIPVIDMAEFQQTVTIQ